MVLAAASVAAALLQPAPAADLGHVACPLVLAVAAGDEQASDQLVSLGEQALPPVYDVLADRGLGTAETLHLLDVVARVGDSLAHESVRPYVFANQPELAAMAVRALWLAAGARSVPTLEFVLRASPSFAVAQAAIEGLDTLAFRSSFDTLADFAAAPDNDPELRARAADTLADLSVKDTRRWLERLRLPTSANPFLRAHIESLTASLEGDHR